MIPLYYENGTFDRRVRYARIFPNGELGIHFEGKAYHLYTNGEDYYIDINNPKNFTMQETSVARDKSYNDIPHRPLSGTNNVFAEAKKQIESLVNDSYDQEEISYPLPQSVNEDEKEELEDFKYNLYDEILSLSLIHI